MKQLDGYVRRELTIDHQISHVEATARAFRFHPEISAVFMWRSLLGGPKLNVSHDFLHRNCAKAFPLVRHLQVQQELQAMDVEELGHGTNFRLRHLLGTLLIDGKGHGGLDYHFLDHGRWRGLLSGTAARFFVDGRCWLSAGCLAADMEYVRGLYPGREGLWQFATKLVRVVLRLRAFG